MEETIAPENTSPNRAQRRRLNGIDKRFGNPLTVRRRPHGRGRVTTKAHRLEDVIKARRMMHQQMVGHEVAMLIGRVEEATQAEDFVASMVQPEILDNAQKLARILRRNHPTAGMGVYRYNQFKMSEQLLLAQKGLEGVEQVAIEALDTEAP